jgi:hypothetical protein
MLFGFGLFFSCWTLHAIIWRIRRPEAYPIWLPIIFYVAPAAAAVAFHFVGSQIRFGIHEPALIAAVLLHCMLSACYICGYAGIVEYSPSAEILRVVQANMPQGISPDEFNVTSLSEQALTGKRIRHLTSSKMTYSENGRLSLSRRGRFVVGICKIYRRAFGLKQKPLG